MAPGMTTPLFDWPDIGDGQTWDSTKQRNVYPTSKIRAEHRIREKKQFQQLKNQVATLLNFIDYNTGNIASLIAKDLASVAAEQELLLLPKVDFCHAGFGISERCEDMMREKIQRYQRQHAHDMAIKNEVDIIITWDCPEVLTEAAIRWVSPDEGALVQEAHDCQYKYLNWDLMHANEKYEDDPSKPDPGECRRPKPEDGGPRFEPAYKGGFYACVPLPLVPQLMNLSSGWGIAVDVVLASKLMTAEEQKEMAEYHAARRVKENEIIAQEAKEKKEAEQKAQRIAEEEYKRRKATTYSTVYQGRFKEVNVHVDQGGI